MRYTEYHAGKAVIKDKSLLAEAMEKLAKLEDVEDTNVLNRWIPCSERLPDGYLHCLVTRRNVYDDGFDSDVREDTYIEIEDIWCWQSKYEGFADDIVAWMPLPKPYKEGEDE